MVDIPAMGVVFDVVGAKVIPLLFFLTIANNISLPLFDDGNDGNGN
jgi:hypothetical protein